MTWQERVLNLLFPPKCPFCGKVMDRVALCPACEKDLPWTGEQAVRTLSASLRCAAPLWYEGLCREGLLRFKFRGAQASAQMLGALLAQCAAEQFSGQFDVVTWVPASKKRQRRRGYDQAQLLAQAQCRVWQRKPEHLLYKMTDNPAQSSLREPAARRANVLGVYEPVPGAKISGRRILLVDDICTTGATLAECSRVLRLAGAADVVCVAVAMKRLDNAGKRPKTEKNEVAIN